MASHEARMSSHEVRKNESFLRRRRRHRARLSPHQSQPTTALVLPRPHRPDHPPTPPTELAKRSVVDAAVPRFSALARDDPDAAPFHKGAQSQHTQHIRAPNPLHRRALRGCTETEREVPARIGTAIPARAPSGEPPFALPSSAVKKLPVPLSRAANEVHRQVTVFRVLVHRRPGGGIARRSCAGG